MHNLTDVSPHVIPIAQSDTTIYDPPLAGLYVFAPGAVTVISAQGTSLLFTFPAAADGGYFPTRLDAQIRKVMDTGTAVADASLFGLK